MTQIDEEWFETIEIGGRRSHYSKFSKKGFTIAREVVEARWPSWTQEDRVKFACAFAFCERAELNDNDQQVLDFLIDNGEPRVWRAIALLSSKHRDRNRALNFLVTRVREGGGSLANCYQALGMLSAPECAPSLKEALSQHRQDVDLHPSLLAWGDRLIYLDYLSCSAALFLVTGQEEYLANIEEMSQHSDEVIRNMARMIARSSHITLSG